MLYCEVRCANLQQICAVWELLKPRAVAVQDGFAALSGPREASVQLRGAVVRLRLAPLQRLQQGLGTVSRWVEALGLLQVAGHPPAVTAHRRWPVALTVTALRLVALLAAAYLAAQYFMRYGPQRPLPVFLDQLLVLNSTAIPMNLNATKEVTHVEDDSWLGALYAFPYLMLVALLGYDAFRCRHTWRKKPTQVVYERFFGIHGHYYTWKVAVLQLMTVALQAAGKLKLLSAIVSVAISLEAEAAVHLKMGFWFFAGLLLVNALYPGLLMLLPHSSMRFAAASIDAFLDLGYTVTYLATVLTALPALSSENAVEGNFGEDSDLKISNQLRPSFAFPSDLLQYAAVYISLAHVLAVCRALERAERDRGKRKPMPRGASMDGGKMMLAAVLSALPLLVLTCIWQGVSYPQVQPGDLRCFPCRCDATSTSTLRLVGCELPAILRYTQLSLSDDNIGQIKPNASFPASLKVLSLSSNPLQNLNGSLFAQLHSLEAR